MKNATFRQLRVFNEVARHLSFIRAAETLHLTPPAITMQIKELEHHVGMLLFDRKGKQVSLTTAGEYMLVYARKILATLKDAEDTAIKLQRAETGVLTIGMVRTAKYFIMPMLAEFHRAHPEVELKIAMGNREKLVKMLQFNDVDIAVMGRPPKELQTTAERFADHPNVFVAVPGHRLTQQERVTVDDLRSYDFIVREHGSGTRVAMEQFFEETRMEPKLTIELDSNETLKQAVMAGLGLGFVSLHTIGLELSQGLISLLRVEGTPVVRAWHVVHTQAKILSPVAEAFRYFVLKEGENRLVKQFGPYWALLN